MTETAAGEVIYEVEARVDPSIVGEFDAWLPGHVREVIACQGFTGAEMQRPVGETPAGEILRRTQYRVGSMAALERYLEQDAPRLRADGTARFGEKVVFSRRLFTPSGVPLPLPEEPVTCRNCGAPVPGRFCAECGQSRDIHVLSMNEVAGDVTHSLLHLDSRVWRTLKTLVLKPGLLTNEFIAGKHQLYLPPFRLYLVISVLFFTLSAVLPESSIMTVNPPEADPATAAGEPAPADADVVLEQIVADPDTPAAVRDAIAGRAAAETGSGAPIDFSLGARFAWLEGTLERAAENIRRDRGKHLGEVMLANAPKFMFVFLPLIAAMALLFYWRPRRLYAEHLVFFLHTHALLFLALGAIQLVDSLPGWIAPRAPAVADVVDGASGLALVAYVPWYLFRAMRVVYGNGRALTAFKFLAISLLYFVLLGVTFAAGMIYSILSL